MSNYWTVIFLFYLKLLTQVNGKRQGFFSMPLDGTHFRSSKALNCLIDSKGVVRLHFTGELPRNHDPIDMFLGEDFSFNQHYTVLSNESDLILITAKVMSSS